MAEEPEDPHDVDVYVHARAVGSRFVRLDSAQGIARITPTAEPVGGHAYLLRGVDTRTALARCCNSWGDSWGKSGEFFLPFADLERLIHEDGEACSAVEKRLTAKAMMPPLARAFVPSAGGQKRRKRVSKR